MKTAGQLSWWLKYKKERQQTRPRPAARFVPVVGFLFLSKPFVCVLDDSSKTILLYDMIWPADHSIVFLKASKRLMFSAAGHHLSLATEERTQLYSHAKTTVSNHQMQLRILFDLCPRCQALQNTSEFHIYLRKKKKPKNVDTVLRIHSGKNAAVDEFSLV